MGQRERVVARQLEALQALLVALLVLRA